NWYTEVKSWKIEPLGLAARPIDNQPTQQHPTPAPKVDFNAGEDDLPF
ncbi:hypothetical protein JGH11_19360, partial [Dysgonomonas sp. Marseille-P4677]|nr:hypothetical protein [Dysgonomonas sp. Marseille-P4677]